jgi:hypothetical protein
VTAPLRSARPSELTAGILASLSIVGSALALAYEPMKVMPFAILLALIATGMAPPKSRLPLIAVAVAAVCFVAGFTIAVLTERPLY